LYVLSANQGITARELEVARRLSYVAVTGAIDAVVFIPGAYFTAWGRTYIASWVQIPSGGESGEVFVQSA
jgi:superfamily I DNA/RNA helicase